MSWGFVFIALLFSNGRIADTSWNVREIDDTAMMNMIYFYISLNTPNTFILTRTLYQTTDSPC